MAERSDTTVRRILRQIAEPENVQKIIDAGSAALVALIRWSVIFLLLYPVSRAGASWIDGITDQQEVITEKFRAGEWLIKEATEPEPEPDAGP